MVLNVCCVRKPRGRHAGDPGSIPGGAEVFFGSVLGVRSALSLVVDIKKKKTNKIKTRHLIYFQVYSCTRMYFHFKAVHYW
jgi:hypothetical protein